MGAFINIGNAGFQSALNGEYIDKSGLIRLVNRTLFTERRYGCVTRSRRFGKTMAAKMLCAYYDQSCNSRQLFADLEIAIDQIRRKQYPAKIQQYTGNLLLVGISYDRNSKQHSCRIEHF